MTTAFLGSLTRHLHFRPRPRRLRGALLMKLTLLNLIVTFPLSANESLVTKARTSITADELQRHVDVLADDTFEGREAGSRGGRAAGNYLLQYLKRGLAPAGSRGSYVQLFGAGYRNLLAKLEGSDPHLKNEYIVIGAHYDHVGYGNRQNSYGPFGYIHNGADDNASGTAVLLEVLDAFVRADLRCRRTIVFAFWDGEEKGLLGSEYWASHPTVPLRNVRLAINMDMVGRLRNEKVEVYGSRSMAGLRAIVSQANVPSNLRLDFKWEVKDNSDHHTFFRRQIPILMFHTGLHNNYHRPSDDVEFVNVDGMRDISELTLNTVYAIADAAELPSFRKASRREGRYERQSFERPLSPSPPRLGIAWTPHAEAGGFRVTRVQHGSAADRGGLQVGDLLLAFNGHPITNSKTLQGWVATADPDVQFSVNRNDETRLLDVQLDGKPTRLGISWREDVAEPGTVSLVRVIPGSPAHLAGLRVNDRIQRINEQTFADGKALLQLARTLPMPIEVQIERDGRIQLLTLESFNTPARSAGATNAADAPSDATETAPATTPNVTPE